MKNAPVFFLLLLALSFAASPSQAQTNPLAGFGVGSFTVDTGATTILYTQTPTSLNFTNGSITLGDTMGGVWSSNYNWNAYSNTNNFTFGLLMSAPGSSPEVAFTVELYNDLLERISKYQGSVSGLTSTPAFVAMTRTSQSTNDFSAVTGLQFTWDGGGSGAVNLESFAVAVVPEPSTWALLGISALTFAAIACRRRSTVRRC